MFLTALDIRLSASSTREEVKTWLNILKKKFQLSFDVDTVASSGENFLARTREDFKDYAGLAGTEIYRAVQKGFWLDCLIVCYCHW